MSSILGWCAATVHAWLFDNLPTKVMLVRQGKDLPPLVVANMPWLQGFTVRLWLPFLARDKDTVYIWYRSRCRTFCYLASGADVVSRRWQWPSHKGVPRLGSRVSVARLVGEGSTREVTKVMREFQGPLYDFHGAKRTAGRWLPVMGRRDTLYILTGDRRTFRLRHDDLVEL